jgi:phosphoribosylpyrophosphate synthetase
VTLKENVILVDDMIDTGGTLAKADLMMEKEL